MMKQHLVRLGRVLGACVLTVAVTTVPAAMATASTKAPGGSTAAMSVDPTEAAFIVGGRTQSKDPTGLTYVPKAGAGVTPSFATGQTWISAFTYTWNGIPVPVPRGYFSHTIWGSGLTITKEEARYSAASTGSSFLPICNWRIDWQSRSGGTVFSTSQGVLHGCNYLSLGVSRVTASTRVARQSSMCARLYIALTFRGEQCHSIAP